MIHCLEIIETKQNIYDQTIEKYKRKMSYFQKNHFNYCKFFYLVKKAKESPVVHIRKLLFKKYMKNHSI